MFDPQTVAQRYGIAIEVTDLGDWGTSRLISEYDPSGPTIRINAREIERYRALCGPLTSSELRALIDFAVAHELYHHREVTSGVALRAARGSREQAAEAFARANVRIDAKLATFLMPSQA